MVALAINDFFAQDFTEWYLKRKGCKVLIYQRFTLLVFYISRKLCKDNLVVIHNAYEVIFSEREWIKRSESCNLIGSSSRCDFSILLAVNEVVNAKKFKNSRLKRQYSHVKTHYMSAALSLLSSNWQNMQ